MDDIEIKPEPTSVTPVTKLSFREKWSRFFSKLRNRLIVEISFGLILIAIVGVGLYFLTGRNSTSTPTQTAKTTPKVVPPVEQVYYGPLDGIKTTKEASERHPLAVMIENDPAARPQSGLDKASIVYETVYDPAATTRFMAIYGTNTAEKVGPIRSIRTMFVDWAHGYDAYLGHWGGNIDALDKIIAEKALDLDEFKYAGAYHREYSGGVALEHTGYSSTAALWTQATKNGYSTANNFSVYKFKDDPAAAEQAALPAAQTVNINFSNQSYAVQFVYDKATNSYKRNLAGKPHVDNISKTQIQPKDIAIMTVKRVQTKTRIGEPGYTMTTIGSGKAQIILDGKTITGTWSKTSAQSREVFYDETGKEVTFDRGQLWICVVAPETQVTIQ